MGRTYLEFVLDKREKCSQGERCWLVNTAKDHVALGLVLFNTVVNEYVFVPNNSSGTILNFGVLLDIGHFCQEVSGE